MISIKPGALWPLGINLLYRLVQQVMISQTLKGESFSNIDLTFVYL